MSVGLILGETVACPWGSYEVVKQGEGFQVKHIIVQPKQRLSLQKHQYRSEHWIIVSGEAEVLKGDQKFFLHVNDSVYIPANCVHRITNPSDKNPLGIIEVQCGSYLGEDDIIRIEDDYART